MKACQTGFAMQVCQTDFAQKISRTSAETKEPVYEKIVVPLDGSELAEVALPYAEELGMKMGSDIILLTALQSYEAHEYDKHYEYIKRIAEVTRYHAEKYAASGSYKTIRVETVARTGDPAETIIEYVDKWDGHLIIMASHGRSGLSRWAVGSVADKVVRVSTRWPVLLIRARGSRSDIREKRLLKKALVPLDGSADSAIVIPHIRKLAAKLEMELTLFQVVPPTNGIHAEAEAYLQSECQKLEGKGIKADYRVGTGNVAEKIVDLADELAFDLVAMSTHGRTGVSYWSLGSVAEKVFLGGNTPLLLVRQ